MKSHLCTRAIAMFLVLAMPVAAGEQNATADQAMQSQEAPVDVVAPDGLPTLGKWMIDPAGTPANWLGATYDGKGLQEPINIILIDRVASSADDAKERLVKAASSAGYPSRKGHSSGYSGYVGESLFPQLPDEKDHAFSNEPYELNNNHGRIFGPYAYRDDFVFIGAFSRERIDIFAKLKHQYASFNTARDDLSQRLDEKTDYEITGFVNMHNAIVGDPKVSTGDHDGVAVLLEARA